MMTRTFLFLVLVCPSVLYAQEEGVVAVQVEVIPATLSLSVSSSRLNFGEVPRDAQVVSIDPASGERGGQAFGPHSTGGFLLTGPPGYPFTVEIAPPTGFYAPGQPMNQLGYSVLWAKSPECEATGFTRILNPRKAEGVLGDNGCARLRIGGTIDVNGITPGLYEGLMTVHIIQQ